jgi:ankyrin repeat protein
MYAAQTHPLACVQKLIHLGAYLNASSVRGKTALMIACKDFLIGSDNSYVQDSQFAAPNQEGPLVI